MKAGCQSWLNCPPIFHLSLSLTPTSHYLNLYEYDTEPLEGLGEVQQSKVPVTVDRGFHLWGIFEQIEKINLSCNCQSLRRGGWYLSR